MQKLNRNKILAVFLVLIVYSAYMTFLAYSPDLTYETVLEQGSMNSEASYTIFQNDYIYYSRDGTTGEVTSNSNFSDLLIDTIEETPFGKSIVIKNSARNYVADTGINISVPVHIRGEGINYGEKSAGRWGTTIRFDSITNATEIYLFEFAQSDWTEHLYFASISDICLDANRVENTKSWPLYIHGQVSDVFLDKVWFKGGGYGGIKITSEVDEVWNIWIKDCLIEENDGAGISLFNEEGHEEIDRVHIVDCHFYDNWDDISIWGYGTTIHNIIIRGCTSESTDRNGFVIRNATMVSIIGNHIIDAGRAAANTYDGIYIYDGSSNITAIGNVIGGYQHGVMRHAVNVLGFSANIRIVANIFGNCTGTTTNEGGDTIDVEFEHNTDT